jgi:DNA polymerase-3 subunit gamma/tau
MLFEQVVGQQHVTITLQNAIQQQRIANAYLFAGPRGVGKTTVARLLSKALNCEKGPTINPCNECSFCIEINESRSLDVFEVDGASNRGIDEVRNLREGLRYSPTPGKYRIYIIDEVHMLTNEAFNALLKTLEEPPSRVLFVFATTEAHKVPATILSRCQRFDFKRITNKQIMQQLTQLTETEKIEIDQESLRIIASKADGSMRDAQSILDQIIAFAGNKISTTDVNKLLGIINRDLYFRLTELITNTDVAGVLQLAHDIFVEGYDFNEFLLGMTDHFRNMLIVASTEKADDLEVSEEYMRKYIEYSKQFQVEDLLRFIKVASDTENMIRKSSNAKIHMEVALVKIVKMSKSIELSELLTHIKKKSDLNHGEQLNPSPQQTLISPEKKDNLLNPLPQFNSTQEKSEPRTETANHKLSEFHIALEEIEKKWQEVLEEVKKKKIALGSFLCDGWPMHIDGTILEIMFSPNNTFQMSSVEQNHKIVEQTLKNIFGCQFKIRCVTDENGDLEVRRKFPAHTDKKSEFKKLLKEDKRIQSIVNTFDAEFVR